jgi:hypothetical protein
MKLTLRPLQGSQYAGPPHIPYALALQVVLQKADLLDALFLRDYHQCIFVIISSMGYSRLAKYNRLDRRKGS